MAKQTSDNLDTSNLATVQTRMEWINQLYNRYYKALKDMDRSELVTQRTLMDIHKKRRNEASSEDELWSIRIDFYKEMERFLNERGNKNTRLTIKRHRKNTSK